MLPFVGAPLGGAISQAAALAVEITSGGTISTSVSNGSQSYSGTTIVASGGTAPYAYDWERVSGDTEISAASDTAATTQWTSNGTDEIFSAVWRCKVTDALGQIAYSGNVSITVQHGTPP